MVAGIVADRRIERRIDHASCHRDCRSGPEPGRLLLVFHGGLLQIDAADGAGAAEFNTARRRCPHLDRAGLQDPLLGHPADLTETTGFTVNYNLNKFLPATVQAMITRVPGDFSNPGSITVDPNPVVATLQSAGPAAQGQAGDAAEEAESAEGRGRHGGTG